MNVPNPRDFGIKSPVTLQPMRIGEILDRSLKLTPTVFKSLLILYVILSVCQVTQQLPEVKNMPVVLLVSIVGSMFFGYYVFLAGTLLSAEHWSGNPVGLDGVRPKITFSLAWRVFLVSLTVVCGTMLWGILLVIPGLVYMLYRILAYYIVVVEDTTPGLAIEKSKFLMSQGIWYKSSSPIARVSAVSLILILAGFAAGAVLGGANTWLAEDAAGGLAVAGILFVTTMATHFITVFSYICYVGFYYDLRARYEGADLVSSLGEIPSPEANRPDA